MKRLQKNTRKKTIP